MKLAILSDIHDHLANLRLALVHAQEAEALLCCGDLCSPFIIKELGERFTRGEIHVVFGNNDADLFRITAKAAEYGHLHLHGEFAELELGGQRFALNHFDNLGRALAQGGRYDIVCFGHNHRYEVSQVGPTLLINPGEIMGELTGQATFVLYDTETREAARIELD